VFRILPQQTQGRRLSGTPEQGCPDGEPEFRFFTTDSVEKFMRMVPIFLGRAVERVERVELEGKA